ncbi:TPA: HP1 family phage holin [Serratia fonticola]
MEKITSFFAYAVAVMLAWVGKYSAQDIALIVGAAVGVGTFAINWYYRRKSYLLLKRFGVQKEVIDALNR